MRALFAFPIRLLFRVGETGVKIIGFMIGFGFRTLGFVITRYPVLIIGALVGLFLGRKQIEKKLSQNGK
jgi:hypothetical protein